MKDSLFITVVIIVAITVLGAMTTIAAPNVFAQNVGSLADETTHQRLYV
jgi:hypothetical protein